MAKHFPTRMYILMPVHIPPMFFVKFVFYFLNSPFFYSPVPFLKSVCDLYEIFSIVGLHQRLRKL